MFFVTSGHCCGTCFALSADFIAEFGVYGAAITSAPYYLSTGLTKGQPQKSNIEEREQFVNLSTTQCWIKTSKRVKAHIV